MAGSELKRIERPLPDGRTLVLLEGMDADGEVHTVRGEHFIRAKADAAALAEAERLGLSPIPDA